MAHGMPSVPDLVRGRINMNNHVHRYQSSSLFSGHIYLLPMHIKPGVKERLLKDIKEVAKELMEGPKEKLEGRVGKI